MEQALIASAYLYVDGHMKLYSGKRKLREVWNSQRRMPLPGFSTYSVGDGQGRPPLFLARDRTTGDGSIETVSSSGSRNS